MRSRATIGWSVLALLALGICGCAPKKPMAHLIDRSIMNLASLSDGEHPWLTLNLEHDPTDSDLCHMRWSPNGRTLAYLDDNMLYTWNDSGELTLEANTQWSGPFWSPNGQFIVVSSPVSTVVVEANGMQVRQRFDGEQIVWWCGDKLCYAPRQFASKRTKRDIQSYVYGTGEQSLPAGLSLVAAAPDGSVLIAQNNYKDGSADSATFEMLGIDTRNGSILWIKPAPSLATRNYGNPDLEWNEKLQMAAQTADAGGGFDYRAYVEGGSNTVELKFPNAANYSWVSGPVSWLGDDLFVPMTLGRILTTGHSTIDIHIWNELALFNGRTGDIRTVSSGLPFEAAAASSSYVAFVVRVDDEPKIVIAQWARDHDGGIESVTYAPSAPNVSGA